MLGCRNGVDKVFLHLAAPLQVHLRGTLRAALEKAWFVQSLPVCIVRSHEVSLKGAASEPLLACAPSKRIGASEVQGSYAPDYCLGPSVSNLGAWHTGEVPASATRDGKVPASAT